MTDYKAIFREVSAKQDEELKKSGKINALKKLGEIVSGIRDAGIVAELRLDENNRVPSPGSGTYIWEGDPAYRFILSLDGLEYGVYLEQEYSYSEEENTTAKVYISRQHLKHRAPEETGVEKFDLDEDDTETRLATFLLERAAQTRVIRSALPAPDPRGDDSKIVRKPQSKFSIGS